MLLVYSSVTARCLSREVCHSNYRSGVRLWQTCPSEIRASSQLAQWREDVHVRLVPEHRNPRSGLPVVIAGLRGHLSPSANPRP